MGLVGVNGIVTSVFFYVPEHRAGHAISPKHKLLKTELISAKCRKTMVLCKSEETVDKWC
jgi:hypothetical protein